MSPKMKRIKHYKKKKLLVEFKRILIGGSAIFILILAITQLLNGAQ